MDEIEAKVRLPQGAKPLASYARYYADGPSGSVIAEYATPLPPDPPGMTCEEMLANFTSRPVPCDTPDRSAELKAGQRRWVKDLPGVSDGGCYFIDVEFDRHTHKVNRATCHGVG